MIKVNLAVPSYLQFAEQLVDHEINSRQDKRIDLNRRKASLPMVKCLEEFDYRHQTTISKRQVNQLLDFSFVDNRHNIVFIGPAGVGKTHLAMGIGVKAIVAGYKVLFTTALALIEALELAELKGELKKRINTYLKFDILIIDEFFADDNVAIPIIDRLIHHSHIFMLGGEIYRLRQKSGS